MRRRHEASAAFDATVPPDDAARVQERRLSSRPRGSVTESPAGRAPERSASKARAAVAAVFYGLVIAVLAWYLSRIDFRALFRLDLGEGYLLAALLVGCAQRFMLPAVWVLMLRSLGQPVRNYPGYNAVYAKGWIGRYLPGKVAMVAVRVYLAETLGASRAAIAVSSIAELGTQMLVALVAGLVGLTFVPGNVPVLEQVRPLAWIAGGVLVLLLWPPFFNAVVRTATRFLRRAPEGVPAVGARTLVWAGAGYALVSLVTGAHAVLVAAAVDPVVLGHPVFVWGAFHLAGGLGMVLLFAPSGLGAREGVYLALLSMLLAPEAAIAVVVLSRLLDVLVDVAFYGLSHLWQRVKRANATAAD